MKRTVKLQAMLATALLIIGAVGIARADHGNDNNHNNNNNAAETRLRTKLSGGAIQGKTPEGNADFRSEPAKGRTRLNVEVEHINLPAATILDVSVQHGATVTLVGHITLNAVGGGELELNSQDGAVVPAVQSGDMVIVSNAGTPILSGTF